VPVLREAIVRGRDWKALAVQQRKQQFGPAAKTLARQRLESIVQSFELLCQIEEQQQQQAKATPGGAATAGQGAAAASILEAGGADEAAVQAATVRVVCSRQVGDLAQLEGRSLCGRGGGDGASSVLRGHTDAHTRFMPTTHAQVHAGGLWEPWCEFTVGVDASKPADPVTISTAGTASSGSSSSKGGGACVGAAIHGRRYRLAAIDADSTRALPTKGKV
jgi:hypothetical protein